MSTNRQKTRPSPWWVGTIATMFAGALVAVILTSGVAEPDTAPTLQQQRQALAAAQQDFKDAHNHITPVPKDEIDEWFEEQAALILDGQPIGTPRAEVGTPAGAGQIMDRSSLQLRTVDFVNAWHVWLEGTILSVNAGSLKDDPEQGLVVVSLWNNFDRSVAFDARAGTHLTQVRVGALRVIGAEGMQVKLEATSGEEFTFDAEEGRFIAPYLDPLPTTKPTPTPVPTLVPHPPVRLVSVDADVTGRPVDDVTTVGVLNACRVVTVAQTFDVDIMMQGLPLDNGQPTGIIGFQFRLKYDPAMLNVIDTNVTMLLNNRAGSSLFDVSGDPADTESEGTVFIGAADLASPVDEFAERTDGVLARITFEAIGPGVGKIDLTEGAVIATDNRVAKFGAVAPATIAVGTDCP